MLDIEFLLRKSNEHFSILVELKDDSIDKKLEFMNLIRFYIKEKHHLSTDLLDLGNQLSNEIEYLIVELLDKETQKELLNNAFSLGKTGTKELINEIKKILSIYSFNYYGYSNLSKIPNCTKIKYLISDLELINKTYVKRIVDADKFMDLLNKNTI